MPLHHPRLSCRPHRPAWARRPASTSTRPLAWRARRWALVAIVGLGLLSPWSASPVAATTLSVDAAQSTPFNHAVRGHNAHRNVANWGTHFNLARGGTIRGVAGGLDADAYDWRDIQSGSEWGNRFGDYPTTLSFLFNAYNHDAEPIFTASVFGGGARQPDGTFKLEYDNPEALAADWVRYTNIIVPNYTVQTADQLSGENRRVYNSITGWTAPDGSGRSRLLNELSTSNKAKTVTYWEIGNEPEIDYIQTIVDDHFLTGDQYQPRYDSISAAMKAVDPTIRTGPAIIYPTGFWGNDILTSLRNAGSDVDFVSFHPYTTSILDQYGNAIGTRNALAGLRAYYQSEANAARAAIGDPDVELIASEYNPIMFYARNDQKRSMASVLATVESVFSFNALGFNQAQYWENPAGHPPLKSAFEMMGQYIYDDMVFSSPTQTGDDAIDYTRTFVTRDPETGDLSIWGLNFDDANPHAITLDLRDWGYHLSDDSNAVTLRHFGVGGIASDTSLFSSSEYDLLEWSDLDVTDPTNLSIVELGVGDYRIEFTLDDATVTVMTLAAGVPIPAPASLVGWGAIAAVIASRRAHV